jgi:Ca2+-binding RTX toxin-like protein
MVAGTSSTTFINEFHYDNVGTDVGEFVEITAIAGTSLAGWTLLLYNANGGVIYNTINLGSITPTTVGGRDFYTVPTPGLQNGAPDGFALVDNNGNVVQFLSYEGTFTASTGPAAGLLSTDVGVSQTGTTEAVGTSLQLTGTGTTAGDFTWGAASIASTAGAANAGQTFTDAGGEPNQAPDGTDATFALRTGGTRVLTVEDFGFTDPDGDAFDSVIITTLPTSGTLLLDADGDPGTPPIAVFAGASIATPEIAAGQLFYVADNTPGSASFTFQVVDEGGTDFGGADTDPTPNTLTFNVAEAQPGTLSIDDPVIVEGDEGATNLVFTITRSGGSDGAVSAQFNLAGGTFTFADLSGPMSGTVNFADGQTTATITYVVNGDTDVEPDETIQLVLTNPTGGVTFADNTGTGTIQNDDLPPQGPAEVFINEIHYDTAGADVGEGIEIAGPAGTNLTGWSLVLYNGNGGVVYGTIALSGVIPNQDDGFGTLAFLTPGLQNGAPDGVALVGPAGQVVQFLSYEGPLTATNGPAAGLTATDIGVSENSAPLGTSLQLGGNGFIANDFTFQPSQNATFGQVNAGQDFTPANPAGTLYVNDVSRAEGDDGVTSFTFNVFRVGGSTGAVSAQWGVGFDGDFTDTNTADFDTGPGATFGTVNFADGETFKTITVRIAGDTTGEPTEFFDLVLFNPGGGVTIGDGLGLGTVINDDPLVLQIGEIQGAGHTSIYVNNEVTTSGIVTAVASNGFYLQDPDGDGNSATSDALFVFTGTAPTVVAGDAITVTGTVNEFRGGNDPSNLTITQLVSPVITVESSGNPLPTAVLIGPDGLRPPTEIIDDDDFTVFDPENDGIDFFESLEGMLVTIQNPVAVDATNGFGELYTVASDGAGNLLATNVAEDGLVTVRGGADSLGNFNAGAGSDFNPERIQIDEAGALNGVVNAVPDVIPGTVLNNVTGVVDYAFGNFQIRPTEAVTVAQASPNVALTTGLVTGAVNQLSLATYNVLNLDIRADDGDDDVGSGRLANIARDIGISLSAPDIVVLQEIQDDSGAINDGTTSALLTLQALADSIFDQTGIRYSVFDNPFVEDGQTGGQPGGNIRVAFLYRADRVDLDEASVFTITDPANGELAAAFQGSRAPLGANFTFNGETVTVIGNHFTSKIGSNTTFSANQPPLNAAELTRAAQAAAVNAYVDGLLAADPDALVAVAGDFNEFQFEEPLRVLTGELEFDGATITGTGEEVLQNLTFLLQEEERFTALFEGNAQAIDHIFASRALAVNAQIDAVHLNTIVGNPNADHDPVLALFNVGVQRLVGNNANNVLTGSDGNDIANGLGGADTITTFGGNDEIDGGFGDDIIDAGDGEDTILGGGGNDTIEGGRGRDFIDGGSGNDRINGGNDEDTIFGGTGNDIIDGGFSDDIIDAGDGNDTVFGGGGNDIIAGGNGRDIIDGGTGNDMIDGGTGNDVINGGTGNDLITGGDGIDTIDAGDGNDIAIGGAGDDRIAGGIGNDRLEGGTGLDTLTGGAGNDRFVLRADLTAADADTVTDFTNLEDRFLIEGATGKTITFTQSGANTLITADGVLVATVRGATASQVQAATQIVEPSEAASLAPAAVAGVASASVVPNAAMLGEVSHSFGTNQVDPLAMFGDAPFVFAPVATAPASNIGAVATTATPPVLTVSALFGSSEADLAGGPASVSLDALVNPLNNPWLAHGQFGNEPVG